MKDKNPINSVHFYCKNDPTKAIKIRKNQVCLQHFDNRLGSARLVKAKHKA